MDVQGTEQMPGWHVATGCVNIYNVTLPSLEALGTKSLLRNDHSETIREKAADQKYAPAGNGGKYGGI